MLVAGFDIYDTVGHQIASRTYMDILRQDAEDNFLRFMPAAQRQAIYKQLVCRFRRLTHSRRAVQHRLSQ